ncbi:MAG TPA: hypothetical protein VKS01_05815 [Bryobacteraceae bacterium]|nr:hypothetical protein [Bryobacteraceae bacterium]
MVWCLIALLFQPPAAAQPATPLGSAPASAPAITQAERIRAAMQASIDKQQASVRVQEHATGASTEAIQLTRDQQAEIAITLLNRVLP